MYTQLERWRHLAPPTGPRSSCGAPMPAVTASVRERAPSLAWMAARGTSRCGPNRTGPHLHLLVTDGGFRPDGTFLRLPLHDVATLTEAFRHAALKQLGTFWRRLTGRA